MDAAIFMRFITMLRNIFLVISLFGIGILVPIHVTNVADYVTDRKWMGLLTPLNVWGNAIWGQVVVAYLINVTIMFFLWWNTKKVLHLRRRYFESEEYQNSLHARTLMVGATLPPGVSFCLFGQMLTRDLALRHSQGPLLRRGHRQNHRRSRPEFLLLPHRRCPQCQGPARPHRPARKVRPQAGECAGQVHEESRSASRRETHLQAVQEGPLVLDIPQGTQGGRDRLPHAANQAA